MLKKHANGIHVAAQTREEVYKPAITGPLPRQTSRDGNPAHAQDAVSARVRMNCAVYDRELGNILYERIPGDHFDFLNDHAQIFEELNRIKRLLDSAFPMSTPNPAQRIYTQALKRKSSHLPHRCASAPALIHPEASVPGPPRPCPAPAPADNSPASAPSPPARESTAATPSEPAARREPAPFHPDCARLDLRADVGSVALDGSPPTTAPPFPPPPPRFPPPDAWFTSSFHPLTWEHTPPAWPPAPRVALPLLLTLRPLPMS